MRRKLRWVLISPEGDEVRSGLSFGTFDDAAAIERAMRIAPPKEGYTLRVFVDGQLVSAAIGEAQPARA